MFALIAALASAINIAVTIWAGGRIAEALITLVTQLQQLTAQIATAVAEIMEAINGVRLEVDRVAAVDAIALVNTALEEGVDLGEVDPPQSDSYQACQRLYLFLDPMVPTSIVFLSPFLYAVTIRIGILKQLVPDYYCQRSRLDEFQQYIDRADYWIQRINDAIRASYTVVVTSERRGRPPNVQRRRVATLFRNGVVIATFSTAWSDDPDQTEANVEQEANAERERRITMDRRDRGVIDMENTVRAWRDAFHGQLRAALVMQVLNRPVTTFAFNPDGLMVDGRILPVGPDLRATLLELLSSREFRNRIQRAWDGFMNRGDNRIALFAYRRLFNHDATGDEITLLRGIASNYGYGAFIATLLFCNEYEERWHRGLPGGGEPIPKAIESEE